MDLKENLSNGKLTALSVFEKRGQRIEFRAFNIDFEDIATSWSVSAVDVRKSIHICVAVCCHQILDTVIRRRLSCVGGT